MIFAYGSLVNESTRPPDVKSASCTIRGWGRQWGHRIDVGSFKLCALTIVPRVTGETRGLLLWIEHSRMQSFLCDLDSREHGYDRVCLDPEQIVAADISVDQQVFMYVSTTERYGTANERFPIWLSYVYCVLSGYFKVYGRDGVEEFVERTGGWRDLDGTIVPILDDRAQPRYRNYAPAEVELTVLDEVLHSHKLLTNLKTI